MSKTSFVFLRNPKSFVYLSICIFIVVAVGFGFSLLVWYGVMDDRQYWSRPLCAKVSCVSEYIEAMELCFVVGKATFDVGVAIATIGGVFVALLSYFSSSGNAALTNHIEHLKVFREYVEAEVVKRDRLSIESIDTLLLYTTIFSQSRSGKTDVSDAYVVFVSKLNEIIRESNARCVVGTPGGFSYAEHQRRVRDHFIQAGVVVYLAPRNDYFEMESQLFSFFNRLNQSFCPSGVVEGLEHRKYC